VAQVHGVMPLENRRADSLPAQEGERRMQSLVQMTASSR
jgi:hypothetical protein